MLLNSPNKRTSSSRFIKTITILVVTLILALLLFFSTSHFIKTKDNSYKVKFYDKDVLLEVVSLEEDETISSDVLESINSKINTYDGLYYIEWSYRKNELVKVDFNELHNNASVYLFKLKNEYTVEIEDSDKYNSKVRHNGPIKYGSRVTVDIDPLVDTTKYFVEVSINGVVQENNDDYTYDINITSDVVVDVALKEIIEIIPKKECKLVYNNIPLSAGYTLVTKVGNIVETSDVLVKYIDEDGNVSPYMMDAGKYEVVIEYIGDEYYSPSVVVFEQVVEKAIPYVELNNNNLYYNGNIQELKVEDIFTNSDGLIRFSNNSFTYPGVYNVIVTVDESKNYEEYVKEFEVVMHKGITNISKYPVAQDAYENYTLGMVDITNGLANVDGSFNWVNENTVLDIGINPYKMVFTPNDSNYESVYFDIDVEAISNEETLRRIKVDRTNLYNEYKDILDGYVYGINDLPVSGSSYNSSITWLSNSTSLKVDKLGNISLVENTTQASVTLTAYIMLGNAAEYATFDFIIYLANLVEDVSVENEVIEVEVTIPTIDEIVQLINNKDINIQDINIFDNITTPTPKEIIINQNIESYNTEYKDIASNSFVLLIEEQETIFIYKTKCNRRNTISEVILWKIISDSAGANGPNDIWEEYFMRNKVYEKIPNNISLSNIDIGTNKIESKQKDIIINFMKGEK